MPLIFLGLKKHHQLILSFKQFSMNAVYGQFKVNNLNTILDKIQKDCFMASIDLNHAYHNVPVALSNQGRLKLRG